VTVTTPSSMIRRPLVGDNLSQLVQVLAREVDLDIRAEGNGKNDIKAVLIRCYNAELRTQIYTQATQDLMAECAANRLPEAAQAIIVAAILAARAAYDEQHKK
jgi:hypothetical protein